MNTHPARVNVLISLDRDTGSVSIEAPGDPLVTLHILVSAQAAVLGRIKQARDEAVPSRNGGVQVAGAGALRALSKE